MEYTKQSFSLENIETISSDLAESMDIPLLFARLLVNRGITSAEQAKTYFSPKLKDLPTPFTLKGIHRGIDLIDQAMSTKRPIIVYGDYDVDGISATALLVNFLSKLPVIVHWHIPHRLHEGYGLHTKTLKDLSEKIEGPCLLITVDNGISAVEEVAEAKLLGFQVLITDHHEPPENLPDADAIINPRQPGCRFPYKELSGTGVTFFFIMALRTFLIKKQLWQKETAPNLKSSLDLVALGTIADVMPLTGTNRILVRAGLEILNERKRPGTWALCADIGFLEGTMGAEDVSFRLAPRINAAGRMGTPEHAARLLMSESVDEATAFAKILQENNQNRRQTEDKILPEAKQQAEEQIRAGYKALVIYQKGWHPGVIGIVAARLCDLYKIPTIVLTDDKQNAGELKGSGRTYGNINIYQAVHAGRKHIIQFGGHPKAVGLRLNRKALENFHNIFQQHAGKQLNETKTKDKEMEFDYALQHTESIDNRFMLMLQCFEPYGMRNPEPIFFVQNHRLSRVVLLKEKHIKFACTLNGEEFMGIGFNMPQAMQHAQESVDMTFKLKQTTFRGVERIEVQAVAIKPTS